MARWITTGNRWTLVQYLGRQGSVRSHVWGAADPSGLVGGVRRVAAVDPKHFQHGVRHTGVEVARQLPDKLPALQLEAVG